MIIVSRLTSIMNNISKVRCSILSNRYPSTFTHLKYGKLRTRAGDYSTSGPVIGSAGVMFLRLEPELAPALEWGPHRET